MTYWRHRELKTWGSDTWRQHLDLERQNVDPELPRARDKMAGPLQSKLVWALVL